MRRFVLLLLLPWVSAPALAGTVVLAPNEVAVDASMNSQVVTLSYRPSVGARDVEISVSIGLERLGWSQVEPVASPPAGVSVRCSLVGGQVRALAFASAGGSLPATPISLCRLRVRPHAHSRGHTWYSITTSSAVETDIHYNQNPLASAWSWVWKP